MGHTRKRAYDELQELALEALKEGRLNDVSKIMFLVEYGYRLPHSIFMMELKYWRKRKRDTDVA
jgi:hypothetical protein